MALPQGMKLPEKLDIDHRLMKDAEIFCSKRDSSNHQELYNREQLMIFSYSYYYNANKYNELRMQPSKRKAAEAKAEEEQFWHAHYSETKTRLILAGTNAREAGSQAQKLRLMLYFKAYFLGISDGRYPAKIARNEPRESMRGKESASVKMHIEHSLGEAVITLEGCSHQFKLPEELAGFDEQQMTLYSEAGNVRATVYLDGIRNSL